MIKELLIFLLAQTNPLEVFEKKEKADTLETTKKEEVVQVWDKENYAGIEVGKDINNERTEGKLFIDYNIKGISFENLFSYIKDKKTTGFNEVFGINYNNNSIIIFNMSQRKSEEIKDKADYYNFQKTMENLNEVISKINLGYGKILVGFSLDNPLTIDITKNKNIEEVRDTLYENDVKIINDYTVLTNTQASSSLDILNRTYFFGMNIGKEFGIKHTKNYLSFTLANFIPETETKLKQVINSNVKVYGHVIVESPAGRDTVLIDEEESFSQEFNEKEEIRDYNVLPILNFESKNDFYFIKLITKKLITTKNKFSEDWYGSASFGLAIKNYYPYLSFGYDNKNLSLEAKVYISEKDKDNVKEELEKIIRENKNIRYMEMYLPKKYLERKIEDLEFKETKNYRLEVGGKVWRENEKVNAYGEIGYTKKPYAIKLLFGNESGIIFSYKDFDFALKYLKYNTTKEKDKEEKINVILQYGF